MIWSSKYAGWKGRKLRDMVLSNACHPSQMQLSQRRVQIKFEWHAIRPSAGIAKADSLNGGNMSHQKNREKLLLVLFKDSLKSLRPAPRMWLRCLSRVWLNAEAVISKFKL